LNNIQLSATDRELNYSLKPNNDVAYSKLSCTYTQRFGTVSVYNYPHAEDIKKPPNGGFFYAQATIYHSYS